ncbi:MAG TPA: glycogen/starch synthase [Patescibacteria group bacterium]
MNKPAVKILFVASEAEPFARAGGLGSVMYSLPAAMNEIGYDARVMIPRYLTIDEKIHGIVMEKEGIQVPTGNSKGDEYLLCNVKKYIGGTSVAQPTTTYFLENEEYYEKRANIYGYTDDPIRWALLSRGVLEFLKVSEWVPDLIICADWQTGYLPNFLKVYYREDPILSGIRTIFSIHNLSYQGSFNHRFIQPNETDTGESRIPGFDDPKLAKINGMKRGIIYADLINTVSPTYAKEIMTPEFGEGLEELLQKRKSGVYGIINGIDYDLWNPEADDLIKHHFSHKKLDVRGKNKEFLQKKFKLPNDPETFLVSLVSRMSTQKGFDLIEPVIRSLLRELRMQLVVVGEGDTTYMKLFQDLQKEFPEQVAANLKFDQVMPHMIFAGADALLVPSRYEPSGLTQMEAMHFGTIPIVRKTGGLADTVTDFSPQNESSTGFIFEKIDSFSMTIAIVRAYENFQNKLTWQELQKRAMQQDFSWQNSAKQYEKIIHKAERVDPEI